MDDWFKQYTQFKAQPWSPTTLKPREEAAFQKWLQSTQLFNSIKSEIAAENGVPVDKLDNNRVLKMVLSNPDYDYRGAFKAGITETISPYDNKPHWPSSTPQGQMLKDPNHPTAWKEFFMRQYRVDPDELGLSDLSQAQKWSLSNMTPETPFYKDPFGAPDYTIK
jgi:hypothetical protein